MANLVKNNQITVVDRFQGKVSSSDQREKTIFTGCDEYFNMYGEEMYPVFQPGQVLMCKQVMDLDFIQYGNTFLIVTEDLRLVRYVKKGSSIDTVLLVSENSHFESFEIPKKHIVRLLMIVGSIKRCGL